MHPGDSTAPIRVTVVQPALPKYRIPVFKELASRPGIELKVCYGEKKNLSNVEADGFLAIPGPMRQPTFAGQSAMLHSAQVTEANPELCDVLVLNWTPRYLTLIPALLRAKWRGVPVVLWGHGFSKKDRLWWRVARRMTGALGHCLLFYDRHTAQQFSKTGWRRDRLFVAPNALDHSPIIEARDRLQNGPQERLVSFRREHGLPDGPVILFVSRLQPENRVDLLVRATGILAGEFPGLKTVIIGDGDRERTYLSELASQLGVGNQVLFKNGIYDESQLAFWFLCSSVFCYPQNIGLSILHAFWYGLPVVTTRNRESQNPEIDAFEEGVNGLAFEHGDPVSLAAVLRTLLLDDERRDVLSEAALQTVEQNYTIKKMVDGIEEAVRAAAGRSKQTQVTNAEWIK